MLRITRVRWVMAFSVCLLVLAGCGGKKPVTVKGNVLLPKWRDVKLADQDFVQVRFVPEAKGVAATGAKASLTDGSFTAKVPPGKYQVSVQVTLYSGTISETLKAFNKAYGSLPANTLSYEVVEEPEQTIMIDLSTPPGKVTKK